jgi:hypothetical protein
MGRVTPAAPQWSLSGTVRRSVCRPATRKFAFRWLAALCLCGMGLSTAESAERSATANDAVNELREAVTELRREEKSYRAFRAAAKKNNSELEEYATFIAGLQLRVFEQCEVVRARAGEEAVREFDCIRMTPNRPIVVTVTSAAAVQTEEEKRATLNARLNDIEGDVDDSLQKSQQEIRQRQAAATTGGGGGGRGSAAGTKDGPAGTPGQPGNPTGQTGSAGSIPGQPQPPSAAYGRPGTTNAPVRQRVMDGGSDDDVVARQLREAAERETDPVLKEKLWAEYKKYREARR